MIESIAVIFSLLSVILTTRKNALCWPVGIIGVLAYGYIFYQNRDWSNFFLQFLFILQSILGWLNWNKSETKNISSLETYERFSIAIASIIVFFCLSIINSIFSGNLTELDAFTASMSIFGMFLLSNSKIEAWLFWILADVIYIYLFFSQQLYLSSILYFIFLILATYGYFNWTKIKRKTYD
jgi:nicotinamide mononucleotide transporter